MIMSERNYNNHSSSKQQLNHKNNIKPFSTGTDFRRQILTSKVDPRSEWVKYL